MTNGGVPTWAKYLLAANAGIDFAAVYFGQVYPRVGWVLIGVNGIINTVGVYLGWGTSNGGGSTAGSSEGD